MARPKITDRATSLAAAFVHAIIPRDDEEAKRLELFRKVGIDPTRCVYCGVTSTDLDHFFALVKGARPSGYFHNTSNLVPACGTCNQSKGAQHWHSWMTKSRSKKSLHARGVTDIEQRIKVLQDFEKEAEQAATELVRLREVAGPQEWDTYWAALDEIRLRLAQAEELAGPIRRKLEDWSKNKLV